VSPAAWPKSVAESTATGRSLYDFVLEGCDRQRALPPIRLGNVYAP
jgi:hypothetical protein